MRSTDLPGNRISRQVNLERQHINEILKSALQKPLTMVVAGAGYGKTHAVSAFLQNYDAVVIWIQLSELDNVSKRFWENYASSFQQKNERLGGELFDIGFPNTDQKFDRYITTIFNAKRSGLKYVVVFDDFHLITSPAVLNFFEKTIRIKSLSHATVILSRIEPQLNTITLLSKNLLTIISEEELRFSKEEMTAYYTATGIALSTQAADDLYQNTDGWVFAICLTGVSLKNRPDYDSQTLTAVRLNLFKLMEAEIFNAVSADMRRLLVRLSLIDHLTRELVESLAGDAALLGGLLSISSFVRYDSLLDAYRIHHLFLDYLREKQALLTEEEIRNTYRKAAEWCDRNNYKMDAIIYFKKIGEYQRIMNIIYYLSQVIPPDIARFIMNLVGDVFPEVCGENPAAYAIYSRLLISMGKLEEAIAYKQETIEKFEQFPVNRFNCRVLYSSYINLGFISRVACPMTRDFKFGEYFRKAYHFYLLGAPFGEYETRGPTSNHDVNPYSCRAGAHPGDVERYIEMLSESVDYVSHAMNGCMHGEDNLARAELAYFQLRTRDAVQHSHQALAKARKKNQYEIAQRALLYLLKCAVYAGSYKELSDLTAQIEDSLAIREDATRYLSYDIAMGWLHIQLGQLDKVPAWIKSDFTGDVVNPLMIRFEQILKVRYHLAAKNYEAVLAYLDSQPFKDVMVYVRVDFLIAGAISHYRLGRLEPALDTLAQAYHAAQPNGLDAFFIEMGNDMRALANAALSQPDYPVPGEWLESILTRSGNAYKKLSKLRIKHQSKSAPYTKTNIKLTSRELSVLKSLSIGMTRHEIAEELNISENTVKSFISSIYNKLGAINRADAILLAKNRGYLE